MEEHKCDRSWQPDIFERVEGLESYGPAIRKVVKVNDKWYAYNHEYTTEIRFCPFCGLDLRLHYD